MKISKFITNITLNDVESPGQIITLAVHQIDGGYIGIDTNYTDEVANYIYNPYADIDLVKLVDPDSAETKSDPSLKEDTIVNLLQILLTLLEELGKLDSYPKLSLRCAIAQRIKSGLAEVDFLIDIAQVFVMNYQQ
jgi:hypothetical protein